MRNNRMTARASQFEKREGERGAALAMALLIMGVLAVVSMSVLAVVNHEAQIANSDLRRTQTFYAAAAGIEKMTSDFSALFARTSRPKQSHLNTIANSPPAELTGEGFVFQQSLALDSAALTEYHKRITFPAGSFPTVVVPSGPFAGLTATVSPYVANTTATLDPGGSYITGTSTTTDGGPQVTLQRKLNNYMIPIFQFGMFSNEDLEIHPGPQFYFNGRVHANGNIYASGTTEFQDKVTTANEIVTDVLRNGGTHATSVTVKVGSTTVSLTKGSVNNGPNLPGAVSGGRGYFPTSPNGTANTPWDTNSIAAAAAGVPNQFGGQVLTRTTGAAPLLLPLQLDGNPTREIIKRRMPNDDVTLSDSRYHTKAEVRILLDDENPSTTDACGIPAGKGVALSTFVPEPLPEGALLTANGGRALWRIKDDGTYVDTTAPATYLRQQQAVTLTLMQADTVRGVQSASATSPNGITIPAGAGIKGRIFIEIVDSNGNHYDVTKQILSLGMTEEEPNGIVYLQRPLWAAFTQGSRDASGGNNYLTYFLQGSGTAPNINGTNIGMGAKVNSSSLTQDATYGYLTNIVEDTSLGTGVRAAAPGPANDWNSIVPINVYNVREGRINTSLDANTIWERGMTSVVEINMRNFARWVDGVFDGNLLAGTNAVSTNIAAPDGYILYVSDRRGDKVKQEQDPTGAVLNTTNGMADNEDIYGPNGSLDPGEDVIDAGIDMSTGQPKKGTLQKDTSELPDPAALAGGGPTVPRQTRAMTVAAWTNPSNYFRRAVRLFNGENLMTSATDAAAQAAGKLSSINGITVATENMVYIWGNYNTTGINNQPAGGASLAADYNGNQVPTSIVSDAFFPLSKTWFDSETALNPDSTSLRPADLNMSSPSLGQETSLRAGIIAGNNLSALAGSPDAGNSSAGESRLCGGMHNFPRFLENWNSQRFNLIGALIPLYHSTQAMGPYNANSTIYGAPSRNWAFDSSFLNPQRLPPGTPQFQYIEATGFKQVY